MKKALLLFLILINHCFAESLGEDCTRFTFALYPQLKQENTLFSPYAIFSNLSMVWLGSKETTKAQLGSGLHLSSRNEKDIAQAFHKLQEGLTSLHLANDLFAHKGTEFNPAFLKQVKGVLNATSVDFSRPATALKAVNRSISEVTQGKIPSLLQSSDFNARTRLLSITGASFQGEWMSPFHSSASMMTKKDTFDFYEDERGAVIWLPLARQSIDKPLIECLIFIPKKENIPHFESLQTWQTNRRAQVIELTLPKFSLTQRLDLTEPLKNLGIHDLFTYQANLSAMTLSKDLFLNKVVHESTLSFDEKGINVTNATQITSQSRAPSSPPDKILTIDRPFYFFLIDHHSQTILFMGHMQL